MSNIKFDNGQPFLKPVRSAQVLDNQYFTDLDYGRLIPVDFYDCIPGDKFNLSNNCLIRTNPLIKPAFLNNLKGKFRSFFVPYRLIYKDWEKLFTNGRNGNTVFPIPVIKLVINKANKDFTCSLLDYFRIPNPKFFDIPDGENKLLTINAFNFLAYLEIWDKYFRNTTIDVEIDLYNMRLYMYNDDVGFDLSKYVVAGVSPDGSPNLDYTAVFFGCLCFTNGLYDSSKPLSEVKTFFDGLLAGVTSGKPNYGSIKYGKISPSFVNNTRDYFTSSLPTPQLGTSPVVPVDLSGRANWTNKVDILYSVADGHSTFNSSGKNIGLRTYIGPHGEGFGIGLMASNGGMTQPYDDSAQIKGSVSRASLNRNNLLSAGGAGFYPRQLRLSFAIDLKQQLLNLSGTRYLDALFSIYGVSPSSNVLQMPDFIGGKNVDIFSSEILQTSSSDTVSPQGNLAGHGIGSGSNFLGDYFVKENGVILTLFWITSDNLYTQGLRRDYSKFNINDYVFPMFVNLGEQEVYKKELFVDYCNIDHTSIFGFQARYNEYRNIPDFVCGNFAANARYWTQAKLFGPKKVTGDVSDRNPSLNSFFIKPYVSQTNRIFNTIDTSVSVYKNYQLRLFNKTVAFRPIPEQAVGSLLDHFGA